METADPGVARARRGLLLPGTQKGTPALCMPPAGPRGHGAGPLLHTKPAGTSEGPLVQLEAKPPSSQPPHPFPPPSPLPSQPQHHADPHLLSPVWETDELTPPAGSKRAILPRCQLWSLISRIPPLLTGAPGAPPMSPQGSAGVRSPGTAWQQLEGFRFP